VIVDQIVAGAFAAAVGLAVAGLLLEVRLKAPPRALMRESVSGRMVPAVLGGPLTLGGMLGLVWLVVLDAMGWEAATTGKVAAAVAAVLAVMFLAGTFDDRRGPEGERGFKGHLRAARSRVLTGGTVKVLGGAVAGVLAAAFAVEDPLGRPWNSLGVALAVPLTANLINLLDRAPGRAGKASLVTWIPLLWFAPGAWALASAGLLGALVICLAADVSERAMLGDAGANPLGAVLGLGIATAVEGPALAATVAVLAGLNLASERWSFSRLIDRNRWLRSIDSWGRKGSET
jgi:UDP-GlcNAc:undecaprenyl-phosphate/decaprenyl-phosphate GlcNAc-1-phosphate transferase